VQVGLAGRGLGLMHSAADEGIGRRPAGKGCPVLCRKRREQIIRAEMRVKRGQCPPVTVSVSVSEYSVPVAVVVWQCLGLQPFG
jgi:hypothetical protein